MSAALRNCKPFTMYITFIAVSFVLGAIYYMSNQHKEKLHLMRFLVHKLLGVVAFSLLLLWLCHMKYDRTAMALVLTFFAVVAFVLIYGTTQIMKQKKQ